MGREAVEHFGHGMVSAPNSPEPVLWPVRDVTCSRTKKQKRRPRRLAEARRSSARIGNSLETSFGLAVHRFAKGSGSDLR
jgi:hypothetical protein